MTRACFLSLIVSPFILSACGSAEQTPAVPRTASDSQAAHVAAVAAAGGVVDSIFPIEEELRRFRASIRDHPDTLRFGSASLDALVKRWAVAVVRRDSAELNAMLLDRAEFAWLYYGDSPMSKPPYEAPPGLLWSQILASSDEGARKVLARLGGAPLVINALNCPAPRSEGRNRVHEGCEVRVTGGGRTLESMRLFGTVIEREGRFKFLGYANAL